MESKSWAGGILAHGVTVNAVVFGYAGDHLEIVLIRRAIPPYKGSWALPGGFVLVDESLEEAVQRELREETGLSNIFLEQLYTFGDVGRDPRGRVVTVAYYGLVRPGVYPVIGGADASQARWAKLNDLKSIAFDHKRIIRLALERLRVKINYSPIGFELLPEQFTLIQIQHLYEVILGRQLDKRNFRKKAAEMYVLKDLKKTKMEGAHRPAALYSFVRMN